MSTCSNISIEKSKKKVLTGKRDVGPLKENSILTMFRHLTVKYSYLTTRMLPLSILFYILQKTFALLMDIFLTLRIVVNIYGVQIKILLSNFVPLGYASHQLPLATETVVFATHKTYNTCI